MPAPDPRLHSAWLAICIFGLLAVAAFAVAILG